MSYQHCCNGYLIGVPRLSESAILVFRRTIDEARVHFQRSPPRDGGNYLIGHRYLGDKSVMGRIESAIGSESEFLASPLVWCLDALRDCAGADHWYTYEKEWD